MYIYICIYIYIYIENGLYHPQIRPAGGFKARATAPGPIFFYTGNESPVDEYVTRLGHVDWGIGPGRNIKIHGNQLEPSITGSVPFLTLLMTGPAMPSPAQRMVLGQIWPTFWMASPLKVVYSSLIKVVPP